MAKLAECLPSKPGSPRFQPQHSIKLGVVVHVYSPSTREVKVVGQKFKVIFS